MPRATAPEPTPDVIDVDAELAAEEAAAPVSNIQADGTVWFSVGVGLINVEVGSVVYERLTTDGLQPVPAPEG